MNRWSPDELPDLVDHVAVVTGATSGIGLATAAGLARRGARVVVTARNAERAREALDGLRGAVPAAEIDSEILDLADLDSVARCATHLADRSDRIDVLVNNAGVMAVPTRRTTAQGFELQFGTNHLGHFALTGLLLPLLLARPASRVVTVSSLAHRRAAIDLEDLDSVTAYQPFTAYGRSKLANVLFFTELDRRVHATGRTLVSVGAHPGLSATKLATSGPRLSSGEVGRARLTSMSLALAVGTRLFGQSSERGALPSLFAAAALGVKGGEYYGPDGLGEVRGGPRRREVSAHGRDEATAHRLWTVSEELTGVSFDGLGRSD